MATALIDPGLQAPVRREAGVAGIASVAAALPPHRVPNAEIAERIGVSPEWIVERTGIHERRHAPRRLADRARRRGGAQGARRRGRRRRRRRARARRDLHPGRAAAQRGAARRRRAGRPRRRRLRHRGGLHRLHGRAQPRRRPGRVRPRRQRADHRRRPAAPRHRQHRPQDRGPVRRRRGRRLHLRRRPRPDRENDRSLRRRQRPRRSSPPATSARSACRATTSTAPPSAASRDITLELLETEDLTTDDIDLFVYHQANARITRAVGERLGLPAGRVVDCIAQQGNTGAATLPLALSHAAAHGMLRPGDRVLLAATGAGFIYGAGLVEWDGSHHDQHGGQQ